MGQRSELRSSSCGYTQVFGRGLAMDRLRSRTDLHNCQNWCKARKIPCWGWHWGRKTHKTRNVTRYQWFVLYRHRPQQKCVRSWPSCWKRGNVPQTSTVLHAQKKKRLRRFDSRLVRSLVFPCEIHPFLHTPPSWPFWTTGPFFVYFHETRGPTQRVCDIRPIRRRFVSGVPHPSTEQLCSAFIHKKTLKGRCFKNIQQLCLTISLLKIKFETLSTHFNREHSPIIFNNLRHVLLSIVFSLPYSILHARLGKTVLHWVRNTHNDVSPSSSTTWDVRIQEHNSTEQPVINGQTSEICQLIRSFGRW